MSEQTLVHLQWEGPFSFADVVLRNSRKTDYGVYHVCGPHPSYGANALLYIGMAQKQTFGVRLQQENWSRWQAANGTAMFYLARLHGSLTPDGEEWNAQIARVEKLLLLAHRPAHNSKDLNQWNNAAVKTLHILNWGERGKLMPEVSGLRWSSHFSSIAEYGPYGSHVEKTMDVSELESDNTDNTDNDEPGAIM